MQCTSKWKRKINIKRIERKKSTHTNLWKRENKSQVWASSAQCAYCTYLLPAQRVTQPHMKPNNRKYEKKQQTNQTKEKKHNNSYKKQTTILLLLLLLRKLINRSSIRFGWYFYYYDYRVVYAFLFGFRLKLSFIQ